MSEEKKSDEAKARRPSTPKMKVVAESKRPNPMGTAVDRLISQLVPELSPGEPGAGGSDPEPCEG